MEKMKISLLLSFKVTDFLSEKKELKKFIAYVAKLFINQCKIPLLLIAKSSCSIKIQNKILCMIA